MRVSSIGAEVWAQIAALTSPADPLLPHPPLGEPQQLQIRFLRAEGYPVDLYYLMDLSYSMKDDLEFVRQLGQALLKRLQEVTHSVRIGECSAAPPSATLCP